MVRALGMATAAVALMASASDARAQGQQVVTQFDDSTISRLLLDVQTTWKIEPGADGRSVYRASADGGISFTVMPQACGPEQGCRAAMLIAVYTRNDTRSLTDLDNFLNAFNDQYATAKAYRMSDGTVVLQSYINAAFGISYTNAQAQLLVYGQNLQKLREGLSAFSEGR